MIDPIQKPVKSCGGCAFGDPLKTAPIAQPAVECCGVPPTPVVIGMKQGFTGPEAVIELLRPRMAMNARACALWAPKIEFIAPILSRAPNKTDAA